MTKNE